MMEEERTALLTYLSDYLDQRKNLLNKELQTIINSRNNETKSSAGDKFETGRARMQQEQDKIESALSALNTQLQVITKIKKDSGSTDFVNLGNLVWTNKGKFLISIGLGKVKFNDTTYYVVSEQSPVGKILLNMKIGAFKDFNNDTLIVNQIV